MTGTSNPFARMAAVFGRGYRRWRVEQLLPSVLFDLNRSLGEDLAIVPEASTPRARGRRAAR